MNKPLETTGVILLPGVALFPGMLLPLYIFEPRYQTMLADALESSRSFAVGLSAKDESVGEVGTIGMVRACVANPDGTSHLVLQGSHRVRFVEWLDTTPYPVARTESLPSTVSRPENAEVLQREITSLCGRLGDDIEIPSHLAEHIEQTLDPADFSDIVASTVVADPIVRRCLLEEGDATRRLEILAAYLTRIAVGA